MVTATTLLTPSSGCTILFVGRRNGAHIEHQNFYRGCHNSGSFGIIRETHGGDTVAGYTDWLVLAPEGIIIVDSKTTDWFVHVLMLESDSIGRHWYNGVEKQTYNPSNEFDIPLGFMMGGGGNVQCAELKICSGTFSRDVILGEISFLFAKHGI
jgi:hypothetical protein